SSPSMIDQNFDRTVVLMIEHTDEGALGVVLNRPADVEVAAAVPQWHALAASPRVIFVGGPVGQGSVLALARADAEPSEEFTPLFDGLGVLDISRDPHEMETPVSAVRLFTGYSGWGPGQLERELVGGAWLVVVPDTDDPLTADPHTLWTTVLNRHQGREAMRSQDPRRHWLN